MDVAGSSLWLIDERGEGERAAMGLDGYYETAEKNQTCRTRPLSPGEPPNEFMMASDFINLPC